MQTELQRDSTANQCADSFRRAILEREYAPGSRLPAERSLAELFGVNRVTVRSALRSLEAEHLVSVRQGRGYVVRDFLQVGGPGLIANLIDLTVSPHVLVDIVADLLLVRRHLARAVIERLGQLGDEVDLYEFERGIEKLEALAPHADAFAFAEADLDVVQTLVAATKSPVLRLCFNPLSQVLRQLPQLQRAMFREPLLNITAYKLVLGWLDEGLVDLVDAVSFQLEGADKRTLAAMRKAT